MTSTRMAWTTLGVTALAFGYLTYVIPTFPFREPWPIASWSMAACGFLIIVLAITLDHEK
jgi:hypothetical protein